MKSDWQDYDYDWCWTSDVLLLKTRVQVPRHHRHFFFQKSRIKVSHTQLFSIVRVRSVSLILTNVVFYATINNRRRTHYVFWSSVFNFWKTLGNKNVKNVNIFTSIQMPVRWWWWRWWWQLWWWRWWWREVIVAIMSVRYVRVCTRQVRMKELEEALEQEREAHSRVSYTVTVYAMRVRVCIWAYSAVSIRHNHSSSNAAVKSCCYCCCCYCRRQSQNRLSPIVFAADRNRRTACCCIRCLAATFSSSQSTCG